MCEEIRKGFDPHQFNAETFFGKGDKETRTLAKVFGFRIKTIVPSSRNACRIIRLIHGNS